MKGQDPGLNHSRAECFNAGVMSFSPDLAENLAQGDANYLSILDEADAFVSREGLDLPEEPDARMTDPDPPCVADPIYELNLDESNSRQSSGQPATLSKAASVVRFMG